MTEKELSRVRKMKRFLGGDISSHDKLELLVSIAFRELADMEHLSKAVMQRFRQELNKPPPES